MKFPYWKLKSVCDGFNYRVVRSEWIPETIEVYSWGKCMENSCKGFLTQLRQFTESVKEDPDWKFVRIEQREKLEKRKSRYLTDLEIKLNQSFQDERRFHPDLLSFRIRAYHEASKMRFVKNYRGVFLNTKTVSFQKRAD
ncbi:MAG: hypothetical protein OEZ34_16160, partial [Spirochaetia bacterium]|nr:hypothetical protein [Spirochaetia bacterium]